MNVDRLPETSTKRMKKPNTIPQKGPFPSFGLVFRMKQHLTKLHYPLFLTVGQSARVLNL